MSEDEQRHRVVLLGAGRVGKTAIAARFLNKTFSESYKPTVEDLHCKDYDINGSIIKVDILDTAGDLAFPAMRRLSISTAHAFVLVYAIDRQSSFEEVKLLWEQIKEQRSAYQDMPCVIVGNKCDVPVTHREVEREDAREWASEHGMESSCIETSAKDNRCIFDIFRKLLDQANIPAVRKLEPILSRRLSAKDSRVKRVRDLEEVGKTSRSRSLMRRVSKPKVKQTGDPSHNDCVIS